MVNMLQAEYTAINGIAALIPHLFTAPGIASICKKCTLASSKKLADCNKR